MFKKGLLVLALLVSCASAVWARDVDASEVTISNVNGGAGTCTINYTLSLTGTSADKPVWSPV